MASAQFRQWVGAALGAIFRTWRTRGLRRQRAIATSDLAMQKLADGVHAFQSKYFATHRALFRRLAERGQHPETLFITCSDSRVVPNLITSTEPGDLFLVRNVGNVVPHVTVPGGTAAAIEYAVEVLGVTSVIVCGHTHCGAVDAILNPETMDRLPFVKRWLAQGDRVRKIVAERYSHLDEAGRMLAAVEENVLVQLENLRAFPNVADRLDRGVLAMSGWVFEIASGDVYEFDPTTGQFGPITAGSIPPAPAST
jgi:carbonic anhydrase